jgi:hypothetical protein
MRRHEYFNRGFAESRRRLGELISLTEELSRCDKKWQMLPLFHKMEERAVVRRRVNSKPLNQSLFPSREAREWIRTARASLH